MGDARRFGGDRVTRSAVMNYVASGTETTIVGDLTTGDHILSDRYKQQRRQPHLEEKATAPRKSN